MLTLPKRDYLNLTKDLKHYLKMSRISLKVYINNSTFVNRN